MSNSLAPTTVRKLGSIYSWLIRQPTEFCTNVESVSEAEKAYDEYLDKLNSAVAASSPGRKIPAVSTAVSPSESGIQSKPVIVSSQAQSKLSPLIPEIKGLEARKIPIARADVTPQLAPEPAPFPSLSTETVAEKPSSANKATPPKRDRIRKVPANTAKETIA